MMPPSSSTKKLRVLFIASEADPWVKVGGLGDVTGSLPRALRALTPEETGGVQLDVRLAIPYHSMIRQKAKNPKLLSRLTVRRGSETLTGQVFLIENAGLPVYLVDGPPFREGDPVYGSDPHLDGERYTYFSLAVLEAMRQIGWAPDVVHANDWHTALSCYWLNLNRAGDDFFRRTRALLAVHNLPFMGAGAEEATAAYGLPAASDPRLPDWARRMPLPLGLLSADHIVAVSPTYAREILTPEFGCTLETFLKTREANLSGILNGLDLDLWNPATDALVSPFSLETLSARQANKQALLKEFALDPAQNWPLYIIISRMDQQKGIDLALQALRELPDPHWQLILLGTGDEILEENARQMEKAYPDQVRAAVRFDARLARRMYAGGDVILMPSRYEPCGMAQMIAMRYGCVPLARATGGLKDTILDSPDPATATGFLFEQASVPALTAALQRAQKAFADPVHWQALQRNGMSLDFSWNRSAREYLALYQKLVESRS
ncbi:glycogen synthase [Levilinea saccharolytica]|nr:glycogen synthase [Levilinea saccharolytica]GAP17750.1 glycogen synthase [Levilinea saccharolytica]